MTSARLPRWSSLAGVVFVVLTVVSGVLISEVPAPGASDETILRYYRDSGNQDTIALAFVLAFVGAPFFLWFLGTLSARIRQAEGEPGWLARIALVSGGAFLVLELVSVSMSQFVPDAVNNDPDVFELDPNLARLLTNGAYTVFPEAGVPAAAPLLLATSLAGFRARFLPRWLVWTGLVLAPLCFLGFLVGPTLVLAWVLLVSLTLLVRPGAPRRGPLAAT